MMPPGWTLMKDTIKFLLRLPPDLHEKLKALADQDDRSLHSLIIHLLRKAVAEKP